jgi:hypothetical protein
MSLVGELDETRLTVVHGSVPDGRFNVRSDLDVLVTYTLEMPAEEPVVVRKINAVLDDIGTETHVKIEANVWPADEHVAARKERMYDLLFSRHLAASIANPDWAVGETDPTIQQVAESSYEKGILRGVVLNYTTYKHAGFAKAPSQYAETDKVLSAFQRALELPKSLNRKMAQFFGTDSTLSHDELVSLGMNDETVEAMRLLLELDRTYTDLVLPFQCATESMSAEELSAYTDWLASAYPKAIDNGLVVSSGFSNFISRC